MTRFTFWYETDHKDEIDPDTSLSFEIEDNDCGVTMNTLAHMFCRFAEALSYPTDLVHLYINEKWND